MTKALFALALTLIAAQPPRSVLGQTPAHQAATLAASQHSSAPEHSSDGASTKDADTFISVGWSSSRDLLDYVGVVLNLGLLLIGFFGVRYAKRSLKAIEGQLEQIKAAGIQTDTMISHARKQAEAAEQAALAARRSADSQINIERPWLLIEDLKIRDLWPSADMGLYAPEVCNPSFAYAFVNYGKTPALVLAAMMRLELCESEEGPAGAKEVFATGNFDINPHVIPQNDSRPDAAGCTPCSTLDVEMVKAVENGQRFLWAYGFVRYKDVHGGYYETRICYRHFPGLGLGLDGPIEYNSAT